MNNCLTLCIKTHESSMCNCTASLTRGMHEVEFKKLC